VGIWVAEKWNLPKDLKSMIEFHHYPVSGGTYDKMASVIHVSDIISRAFGYHGGDDSIPVVSEYAWKKLEMDNLNWKVFLKRCEEEIDKASVFLEEI
jgi:HD-like signal output (HDOD) protein